jgi:carboxypeptidase Taq
MNPGELRRLNEILGEVADLGRAGELLWWDERTMMPPRGQAGRADLASTLVRTRHRLLASEELADLLGRLAAEELPDPISAATVRMAKRDADKARRVPAELQAELARAESDGEAAWRTAREKDDFASLLPFLERNIELRRRYIDCFEVERPYDALLDDYEPGMRTVDIEPVLRDLREGLVPLVAAVSERQGAVDASPLEGTFDVEAQERAVRRIVAGLPLEDGTWRLDRTAHPFALAFSHGDIRLTTRYDPGQITFGLFSSIHEAGHGLYESGVPPELWRGPLGQPPSLGFHESQSRLWENWVGLSRPFLASILPILRDELPGRFDDVGPEDLYRAANRAGPTPIRVEADEVTYNLHIALRFELELALVEGRLGVADLPAAWDEATHRLLGLETPSILEGVLQDIHWGAGMIGYFPTYTLGNLMAAQLWRALTDDLPDIDGRLAAGEFGPLREWLREHVHRHGRKFESRELLRRATGEELSVEPWLAYLEAKLLDAGLLTAPVRVPRS